MSDHAADKATFKRWYDHDPMLIEVLEALRQFQEELKEQSQAFLEKIDAEIGEGSVDRVYDRIRTDLGDKFGRRWYDQDPTVSRAVEILRMIPPDAQRKAAQGFLESLKKRGINLSTPAQQA